MKGRGTGNHQLLLSTITALLLATPSTSADTLQVPSQYATIQAAVDAAVDGDVVEIADGVYTGEGNKNVSFLGKAITVRGASGEPELCVIDCEGDGRGFIFENDESTASVLAGLTITNGHADMGGAVLCNGPRLTIDNCVLCGNTASGQGGAIYFSYCYAAMNNCVLRANAAGGYGGAVFCDGVRITINNCALFDNTATNDGGAFGSYWTNPTFTNCVFAGNHSYRGGAIAADSTLPTYSSAANCTVVSNSATDGAGGIYCTSTWDITNCIIRGNSPDNLAYKWDPPTVTYCNIEGGGDGEGNINADPLFVAADDYHLSPGSPCVDAGTNNPIVAMPVVDLDGDVRVRDGDGDVVATVDMGAYELHQQPGTPFLAAGPSLIRFQAYEGFAAPADQALCVGNYGPGAFEWEITGQPAWLTVTPTSATSGSELDDVTLSVDTTSLVLGTYQATLVVRAPAAGNSPRQVVVEVRVSTRRRVPAEYATIQAAVDAAVDGDEVVIANGTYTGTGNKDIDLGGKAIVVRSESGIPEQCVIDCENIGRGFIFHNGEGPDTILRGLTVTNGYEDYGGAIYCDRTSPTIADCLLDGNEATSRGGGIYCYWADATISNCFLTNNSSEDGGGIYAYGGLSTISNCVIAGNSAGEGGGVWCHSPWTRLTHCTIVDNTGVWGAGLCTLFNGAMVTNCVIWGNGPRGCAVLR